MRNITEPPHLKSKMRVVSILMSYVKVQYPIFFSGFSATSVPDTKHRNTDDGASSSRLVTERPVAADLTMDPNPDRLNSGQIGLSEDFAFELNYYQSLKFKGGKKMREGGAAVVRHIQIALLPKSKTKIGFWSMNFDQAMDHAFQRT